MSIRNLSRLFNPRSVAVIGATDRAHSVGATVLNNLIDGGFTGEIFPVNLRHSTLAGLKVYSRVGKLPRVPDLALICTPPDTVPGLIRELGECGTKAAIVLTAGLAAVKDRHGNSMKDLMLAASKPYLLRILGPNCVGLLVPHIKLNASFAHVNAIPGKIAFVSQSGAMVTGVLDWAKSRGIGFSKFISLGDSADVDFGDLLDYLASDGETQAILLYIEAVTHARKFMSAARAAARSKPTIVIKAGRLPEGAKAASSHTGAMAGADDVYDAAIRRAGMLRVLSTEELFAAVETLAHMRPLSGDRLAILTNGGGPGVIATDALIAEGGHLASLSEESLEKLDQILPANWSRGNPVDIIGDAPGERYEKTMEILAQDPKVDATLLIHAPTAIVPSDDIASILAPLVQRSSRNILSCWFGGDSMHAARRTLSGAGVPTYDTPEDAIRGFMQMVRYRRNQELLMQVPSSIRPTDITNRDSAYNVVRHALASGREMLSEPEAKSVLASYGIPVVKTREVGTVDEAVRAAEEIGFPVALKILSPDIVHKSDVGGVVLDLDDAGPVRLAGEKMVSRLHELMPDARLVGFSVQSMARRPEGRELIVGIATDPVFGPVILFGQGGVAVEVVKDHAIALPPLNHVLAKDLVCRTRIARLLGGYRNRASADLEAIYRTLIQISELAIAIPEIVELDVNPLVADANGVIALDARIRVKPARAESMDRLAIRPYPAELEECVTWHDQQILVRPIKPEDGLAHLDFFHALSAEDVHNRFFVAMRELDASRLARLTQIDYDREMAFVALKRRADGSVEILGVSRCVADPDNISAEFAVTVRSDLKGQGLGTILLAKLIAYCRIRGLQELVGETLCSNVNLLRLANHFGFNAKTSSDGSTMLLNLPLHPGE
ncbi:acetyltransferase [Paucimonas lemoignei]|uniref:Acetyltransferase n=1 Tax=Paucimonas lemoignei TaxID=29443 RepID=A0A4R3I3W9_PAULE|nr:bifunctional acetate--CoA ligase family protein/GNAT family N-acetyltransferase [Paucimonas lemoignei]TCS39405.1 acetyltransferase [Paucimonas lemoignei]